MRTRAAVLSLAALGVCSLVTSMSAQAGTCSGTWSDGFMAGDLNSEVSDILTDGNSLVFAGLFRTAGDVETNGVARLVDNEWQAVGAEGVIAGYALGHYQESLVLSGIFRLPGNERGTGVARWTGTSWEYLGEPSMWEYSVAWEFVELNSRLYAVVNYLQGFGSNVVASWNGSSWTVLPDIGDAYDIAVHNGKLYASGHFEDGDDSSNGGVACWNGSAWESTHAPMYFSQSIVSHDGHWYASVSWTGGAEGHLLYEMAEGTWLPVPGTWGAGGIRRLVSTPQGVLICGDKLHAPNGPEASVLLWDGHQWHTYGPELTPRIADAAFYQGRLIATGTLTHAGGTRVNNVAERKGSSWSPLHPTGDGINGYPSRLSAQGGQLFACGLEVAYGTAESTEIASWNGTTWESGGQFNPSSRNPTWFHNVTSYNDSLYAIGFFPDQDAYRGYPLAKLSNGLWEAVSNTLVGSSTDVITRPDGVVVAGDFWFVDNPAEPDVVRWDGSQWHVLGELNSGSIYCLGAYQDRLVIGGDFSSISGVNASNIAILDDDGWHPVGGGLPDRVYDTIVYQGQLYAASWDGTHGLLRSFNGSQWSLIATSQSVGNMAVYDGQLYLATGDENAALLSGRTLHVLTPEGLVPVAGAPDSSINSLAVYDDGDGPALYSLGPFSFAGSRPSSRIARYTTCPCAADANYDGVVNGADLSLMLSRFGRSTDNAHEGPDLNGDQLVSVADLSVLLARFGQPCP